MNYYQLRLALKYETFTPVAMLSEALPYAEQLAPVVAKGLAKRRAGVPFTTASRNLLLRGLYVCAAARRRELWDDWVDFLTIDRAGFEDVFGLLDEQASARITLCLIDTDNCDHIDALFRLLEDDSLFWGARQGLWLALARLTAERRVDRKRTVALLCKYPHAYAASGRDLSLYGWIEAIVLLGLQELMPVVERLWATAPVWAHLPELDKDQYKARMSRAARESSLALFDEQMISDFDDPADGLFRFIHHEGGEIAEGA